MGKSSNRFVAGIDIERCNTVGSIAISRACCAAARPQRGRWGSELKLGL